MVQNNPADVARTVADHTFWSEREVEAWVRMEQLRENGDELTLQEEYEVIGAEMGISPHTVRTYIERYLDKCMIAARMYSSTERPRILYGEIMRGDLSEEELPTPPAD